MFVFIFYVGTNLRRYLVFPPIFSKSLTLILFPTSYST